MKESLWQEQERCRISVYTERGMYCHALTEGVCRLGVPGDTHLPSMHATHVIARRGTCVTVLILPCRRGWIRDCSRKHKKKATERCKQREVHEIMRRYREKTLPNTAKPVLLVA